MLTGWLIYSKQDIKRNKSYIEWFIEEAEKQQVKLTLLVRENMQVGLQEGKIYLTYQNENVSLPDFAVVRTVEPLLNMHLESLGLRVFNPFEVSDLCNHKMKTYYAMTKLNVPIMNTMMVKRNHLTEIPPSPYPFVIKESTGRGGGQVHFIEKEEDWKEIYNNFTTEDLVLQNTDVQKGKDLRVFVIGKEIISAVLRVNEGSFHANYSLGGSARKYELNDDEKQLINKIVQAYPFDLVGIDFLVGYDGQLIFNEIEDVVGSRILSAVTNINLLEKYVSYIKEQLT